MKIKKVIILSIILTILTIGAVNAVENTSDNTNNVIENVGAITDDNTPNMDKGGYTSTNSERIDSDKTSTRYVDKKSSEDFTLKGDSNDTNDFKSTFNNLNYVISRSKNYALLNQNYTFDSAHDMEYVNGIEIHRNNLIIDGNNHIINGTSLARIFNVTGKNITFQNIVFVNGNSENGGVLYITGNNVKLINCTFMDNHAENFGGAIYLNSGNLDLIDCTFKNNNATSGGAIYVRSSFIDGLIDSVFVNNSAVRVVPSTLMVL